jgi:hypothetical protein
LGLWASVVAVEKRSFRDFDSVIGLASNVMRSLRTQIKIPKAKGTC